MSQANRARKHWHFSTVAFFLVGFVTLGTLLLHMGASSIETVSAAPPPVPAPKTVLAQGPDFTVERDVSVQAGKQGWTYWPVTNQRSYPDTVTIIPSNAHEDWFMSQPAEVTIPPGYVSTLSFGCDASMLIPGTYYADFTLNDYSTNQLYGIDDFVLKCTVTP